MMGDTSNLGYDNFSHKEYLSNSEGSKQTFHKNFSNFFNNYDGNSKPLVGFEVVAEGTASLHPDYDKWV